VKGRKEINLPEKYFAAIDMGTNSFHLIIAEVIADGKIKIVDRQREVIRLGSRQGGNLNIISEEETELALNLLKSFKKLAGVYNAKIIAAATSAVREAENRNEFVNRVLEETGIEVNILEGKKEAELIYSGAEKALSLGSSNSLCIDIGGGSSEIIYAEKGNVIFAESIKIGAVRLSNKFFPGYVLDESSINRCSEYVVTEIINNNNLSPDIQFEIVAGTSGTIQSIARTINIIKYKTITDSPDDLSFTRNELESLYYKVIGKKTLEERLTIAGIEEKRADILPAGLIILRKLFELFNISGMKISDYSLREGLIFRAINSSN
jgi:exopolyphosphatase/guanosine-5'-triphosphate,3'-diphosphate pyrophosphatase